MIPIRPSKKFTLYTLIGLSFLFFFIYLNLSRYWRILPDDPSLANKYTQTADSLINSLGIPKDSLVFAFKPLSEKEIVRTLSEKLGAAAARRYIADEHLATVLFQVNARRRTGKDNNVNFSLGNNALGERSKLKTERTLIFSSIIGMDGTLYEYSSALPQIPTDADSATALRIFSSLLPKKITHSNPIWISDSVSEEERSFRYWATLKKNKLHRVKAYITLTSPDYQSKDTLWHGTWSVVNDAGAPHAEEFSSAQLKILSYVFIAIIFASLLAMIVVFIVQLRNRIVNLWVLLWLSLSITVYFVLAQAAVLPRMEWYELLILVFFNFIFLGFLLGAIPLSGLIALAQKTFPEKFYTLLRLTRKPWNSYYFGRSVIIGLAAGSISSIIYPVLFALSEKLGTDRLYSGEVFPGGLIMMMGNLPFTLTTALLFIPVIGLAMALPGATLGLLRFPQRYKYIAAMILTCFYSVAISTLQGDTGLPSYIEAFLGGIITFGTLMIGDVLAVLVAQFVSTTLMFIPAMYIHDSLWIYFAIAWCFLFASCFIAFIRTPERVEEEDYKPDYLIRFEEEQRIRDEVAAAKVVQQRLLPAKMPKFPQADIAAYCLPAFEVGGDYYDFFPLNETQLGVLIADVSGKGMSAAFYITLAKGVIVSQIHQSPSPAEVLKRVNKLLFETMERGKFISMIYGVLDVTTMKFIYAQAGHNPIVIRTAYNGKATSLESRGLALGLDKGSLFDKSITDNTIDMSPGDAIVLYTDGVVEAMNNDKLEYGMDSFLAAIQRYAGTAPTLLNAIIQDVKGFIGKSKQHDDITVIVIRRPENITQLT